MMTKYLIISILALTFASVKKEFKKEYRALKTAKYTYDQEPQSPKR